MLPPLEMTPKPSPILTASEITTPAAVDSEVIVTVAVSNARKGKVPT